MKNTGIYALIDFYDSISIDSLQVKDVFAFVTGVDTPFLNVVIDPRHNRGSNLDLITEMTNFFAKHNVQWGWFVTPASYDHDLLQHGFCLLEEDPAMYFDLGQELPIVKTEDISITELATDDDLLTWIEPINEAFEGQENDDSYRKLNVDALKKCSGKFKHYVAYYKGNIAGSGTLFISKGCVMLHNLGTKICYTKRGIGMALTVHMLQQAKHLGYKHCFLDASKAGFKLYQKLGFNAYGTTLIYSKTSTADDWSAE